MAYEFKHQRRIEFYETDMAGIVHFSNYFRFMESAEQAFLRSLGFSVVLENLDPPVGFPRVHAECDYKAPLRFEELVEIHLLVRERRAKVVTYEFRFRNLSADPIVEVARGVMTMVCVTRGAEGELVSVSIPAHIAERIDVAPPRLLAD